MGFPAFADCPDFASGQPAKLVENESQRAGCPLAKSENSHSKLANEIRVNDHCREKKKRGLCQVPPNALHQPLDPARQALSLQATCVKCW